MLTTTKKNKNKYETKIRLKIWSGNIVDSSSIHVYLPLLTKSQYSAWFDLISLSLSLSLSLSHSQKLNVLI